MAPSQVENLGTSFDGHNDAHTSSHTCVNGSSAANVHQFHPTLAENDATVPIAIIGMAGRFPGEATDPEKLWEMIVNGRSARTEVPKSRFNIDAFYHPHAERSGTMNIRGGHYLKQEISAFDAPFFSITANEAKAMDPQQRMDLEVAYEALENAGLRMEDVAGSSTGVYMASFTRDYANMRSRDPEYIPRYEGTGNGSAMFSNRISWFFDLKGPSLSLDTACSSSLVALHLACQSLRTGEAKQALVGGTNVITMPEMQIGMTSLNFLGADSKCFAFDHRANGYARGEGTSVVVLKPLKEALKDGDMIRAVIRGTGVNQDGKTPGITLPSAKAQEELIRMTYKSAGLDFADTHYFEAHGTGTQAGDPREAAAIGATFGTSRRPGQPLLVGTIKTNIGHLEGASGLAGLVKSVHILEKAIVPPNLWFEKVNLAINLDEWGIEIPTIVTPWPQDGLRRISINSFGYGGTNAHAIIDDAAHYLSLRGLLGHHNSTGIEGHCNNHVNGNTVLDCNITLNGNSTLNGNRNLHGNNTLLDKRTLNGNNHHHDSLPRLFFLSSNEQNGVARLSKALLEYLFNNKPDSEGEATFLARLALTLGEKRSRLPWKSFAVASNVAELEDILNKPKRRPIRSSQPTSLAFIFTGQGAQWHAMGIGLLSYPVFRKSLQAASAYLKELGCTWDLISELSQDVRSSRINDPTRSQPLCTVLQIALVDLLADWGVKPKVVIGHSSGEIAAAYSKGAITKESGWAISYHRGRVCSSVSSNGAMAAVGLGEAEVHPYLDRLTNGHVVVACINSPTGVTLSGDVAGVEQAIAMFEADKIFARRLIVKNAYHSSHMAEVSEDYLSSLSNLAKPSSGNEVLMFSSVTGALIDGTALDANYWRSNMVNPVKFYQAVQAALSYSPSKRRPARNKVPFNVLLEVGPHSALQGPLKQIIDTQEGKKFLIPYFSILSRGTDAIRSSLETLGKLVLQDLHPNFNAANRIHVKSVSPLTNLPPFAWNRELTYWYESAAGKAYRHRTLPRHDLVGALSEYSTNDEPSWRNYLRVEEMPWMEHHKVQGSVLYPLAGMIVMVLEAAKQVADKTRGIEGYELRDVAVLQAMIVPIDDPVETKLQFRPYRMGTRLSTFYWTEFTISCRTHQGVWTQHCSGLVTVKYKAERNQVFSDEKAAESERHRAEYRRLVNANLPAEDPKQVYATMGEVGLQWGPTFTTLTAINSGEYEAHCILEVPTTKTWMPMGFEYSHIIHPACLDSVIQMTIPASTPINTPLQNARIPRFIESFYISSNFDPTPGTNYYGYSKAQPYGFNESIATMVASFEDWEEPLIVIKGCRIIELDTMGSVDGSNQSATSRSLRKIGGHPIWDLDIGKLDAVAAQAYFEKFADIVPNADPKVVYELELACYILCKRVLRQFNDEDAQKFSPHHRIFYEYMKSQHGRALAGKLDCQSPSEDWLNTTEQYENALLARVANATVDGKLMVRLGTVYDKIFRGEVEPLQIMREDDLLTQYYRNAIGTDKWAPVLTKYIQSLAHKRPELRIFEVGAGTGGTTKIILEALGGREETSCRLRTYTFTDISSGFFEAASKDFEAWESFLEYKVINIEQDIAKQGAELGTYDVVVANNVLHATGSIVACLQNCKALLKADGVLVLGELTCTLARIPMVFGTLSGWWMGRFTQFQFMSAPFMASLWYLCECEDDGRKLGPRIPEFEWDLRLRQTGFNGIDLKFRDHDNPDLSSVSLMVSRNLPLADPSLPPKVIIVEPELVSEDARQLSSILLKSLYTSGVEVKTAQLGQLLSIDMADFTCISLLETDRPVFPDVSSEEFEAIKHLILSADSTLWVTRGAKMETTCPEANLIAGLGRTIRGERPTTHLFTLDLDPKLAIDSVSGVKAILKILRSITEDRDFEIVDWEYSVRDDKICIQRLDPDPELDDVLAASTSDPLPAMLPFKQPGRALALSIRSPGILNTFEFIDDERYGQPLADDEVEIEVKATGMNFHDLMVALGQIFDTGLGVECSGIVTRIGRNVSKMVPGDRVITFGMGCYRTFYRNLEHMCEKIPDHLSFADAASIPCIYTTVYYALIDMARLQAGETILIHAAAGGLGQAAIILAKYLGAEIFVTVSTDTKKQFLIERYGVLEDHVFNSRDLSFSQGIKRMTNQQGVDVVLNSLSGEALRQSWLCVAPFGRFIEVGKRDITGNTGIDMSPFMNNIVFAGVNMLSIYRTNVKLFSRIISDVLKLLTIGIIRPVYPVMVWDYSQIEEAFRTMQTGKHIGKIVLTAGAQDLVPIVPPKIRGFQFSNNATYIIPGGLGGLGRSISAWMVDQGARNLVFTSRSGAKRPEAQALIRDLTERGAKVEAFACDISNVSDLLEVLEQVRAHFPPIRGVLTCAMHLQDVFFENMTVDDFKAAIRPKVQATRNLHDLLPQDMDFFVCLSSVGGIVGSRGQSNYNAGNTYQDALMHYRASLGLKATSINLGLILNIGITAEKNETLQLLKTGWMLGIKEKELITIVQAAIEGRLPTQILAGLATGGLIKQNGHDQPYWFSDARFTHLRLYDTQEISTIQAESGEQMQAGLVGAKSLQEATDLVCRALVRKLAKAMMMDVENLDPELPANSYGVDSLVAVEIRAWVFKEAKSEVSVFDILSNAPLSSLSSKIVASSALLPAELKGDTED
ncbi:hypothetical protein VTL71DRAFT_14453 [Oculimacula yallundae]|uniref:Polyketide synthase n=1 Tax=Oculimacula yallundae TaxID=86028 RepID=A0ABR4CIJ5_9HELO